MALRKPVPPNQCIQCWTHAYDKDIHKALRGGRCAPCESHVGGCPPEGKTPPKPGSLW